MNDALNTEETKKKPNNIRKLLIILAIIVVAVAAYIIYSSSSSKASYTPTKNTAAKKKVRSPKKVGVVNTAAKTKQSQAVPKFDVYVTKKIDSDKTLSATVKQALLDELTQYNNYLQTTQEKNAYLEGIEKMSMELRKLTLQSDINKQQVQLSQGKLALERDAVDMAKLNGTFTGKKKFNLNSGQNKAEVSPIEGIGVGMIYKANNQYNAVLNINDNKVKVQTGSIVNNGTLRVDTITKQTVMLTDIKTQKTYSLSLTNLMGQV